jgi:hypothetical protein
MGIIRGVELAGAGFSREGDEMFAQNANGDHVLDAACLKARPCMVPNVAAIIGDDATWRPTLSARLSGRGSRSMQHTGKWWKLFSGITLVEALRILRTDGVLHPPALTPPRAYAGNALCCR